MGKWEPRVEGQVFCQIDMERALHETGVYVGGDCEIRQKWYRSGVTPRTYYAQGGIAFHSSKCLQNAFSQLVDSLPVTNHILRLAPTRLDIETPETYVFIYDLTSFTSNFHEHQPFMSSLAEFCIGTPVKVLDGFEGIVEQDLGELLFDYTRLNCQNPTYSRERRYKDDLNSYEHLVAGFLGVYGNLMTCTFLHGVVLLAVIGDVHKCYAAGDDGGAVVRAKVVIQNGRINGDHPWRNDVMLVFFAISLLGIVAWSKVFMTSEPGAIALKRPLSQFDNRLSTRPFVIWPSTTLMWAYIEWNQFNDPRFPDLKTQYTRKEVKSAIIGEITRFLRHVAAVEQFLSEEDLRYILQYTTNVYNVVGIPREGLLPQSSYHSDDFICVAPNSIEDLRKEPIRRSLERLYTGYARIAVRVSPGSEEAQSIDWYPGYTFISKSSKELAYYVALGFLEKRSLFTNVTGEEGFRLLVKDYLDPQPAMYEYIVSSIPRYFRSH